MTLSLSSALDASDTIRTLRGRFVFPRDASGDPVVYLAGNSLGLQPRAVRRTVAKRLEQWGERAVQAWHESDWMEVETSLARSMARIVGAQVSEVAVTGTLTGNLHNLMASFYRPSKGRTKVLMESGPFPSDRYAVAGQTRWHGLSPEENTIMADGSDGVLETLQRRGDEIAVVLVGGVNYYTGEALDMGAIADAAQAKGCLLGLDLAHAAGNVQLCLHDWNVDFAAWCGYKYLNGGPGAPAALFVHERHHQSDLVRLGGWWGHELESRFKMPDAFSPASGASGWQMSTPSILALAPLEASMAIFDEVGMEALLEKSSHLTTHLDSLITERLDDRVSVVTPAARGAQLSLRVSGGRQTFQRLSAAAVVCDWREPDVIRVAPAPLYNTFGDIEVFVERLASAMGR